MTGELRRASGDHNLATLHAWEDSRKRITLNNNLLRTGSHSLELRGIDGQVLTSNPLPLVSLQNGEEQVFVRDRVKERIEREISNDDMVLTHRADRRLHPSRKDVGHLNRQTHEAHRPDQSNPRGAEARSSCGRKSGYAKSS
jgi:hypothetical protein